MEDLVGRFPGEKALLHDELFGAPVPGHRQLRPLLVEQGVQLLGIDECQPCGRIPEGRFLPRALLLQPGQQCVPHFVRIDVLALHQDVTGRLGPPFGLALLELPLQPV